MPIYRLDWLVVTHADADHHNGVPWLLSRVRVERALLHADLRESELCARLRADGAAIRFLAGGERARLLPGLEVAAPRLPAATSPNDRSLWTRIELLGTRVLLPGDAEALGIAAGLAQGLAQPADVLVLPHHGRDNPAGAALLQRVRPRCCLASAAAADGETALGELARRRGAELWVTGQHGDLELRFGTPSRLSGSTGARALPR